MTIVRDLTETRIPAIVSAVMSSAGVKPGLDMTEAKSATKLSDSVPDARTEMFRRRPLRAHSFLADVPLHSLDCAELPGGRFGLTLREISDIIGFGGEVEMDVGPVTQSLFGLRALIGRIFHWEEARELESRVSYISRLTPEDRARSLVSPGKPAGISRILYEFEHEMLAEIINRTVHCFWLMATEPTVTGYQLWVGVYVKRLNWFTPIYMAVISPLLEWIIYPSMIKGMRRRWAQEFPLDGMRPGSKS